jgi:hypothetical protein
MEIQGRFLVVCCFRSERILYLIHPHFSFDLSLSHRLKLLASWFTATCALLACLLSRQLRLFCLLLLLRLLLRLLLCALVFVLFCCYNC